MSNNVSMGNKKKSYKSIRLAAEAAGLGYMVFYMRLRAGQKPGAAARKPVRKYQKQEALK